MPDFETRTMTTRSRYDAIYLSPHLDDAAISCGGQIALRTRRGEAVLVVTISACNPPADAHSPLADELNAAWGWRADAATRREEDRRACGILGAECLHWDEADGLYRRDPERDAPLYPTRESLFASVHRADDTTQSAWIERLRGLPPAEQVLAPLGAGGHVDHQLVRRAAEAVFGASLRCYEDFPYALRPLALCKVLRPRWRWRSERIALDERAVRARREAAAAYASQMGTLFFSPGDLERRLRRHIRRARGERLWQKTVISNR